MRAIRTDMMKTVDQMNDVLITLMIGIGGDDALQDFQFEYWMINI